MLDAFRHFTLVVEHGTFTAAARAAHLSQPALTASIQKLEASVGATLFDRGHRASALTAAGEALLPHARAALASVDAGFRSVEEIVGLRAGRARIGAGTTVCSFLLPPILARWRKRHPALDIVVREMPAADLFTSLEAGQLDLVLSYVPSVAAARRQGLAVEPWFDDELVIVQRAGQRPRSKDALRHITLMRGTTTRALLERFFPDADVVMELSSIASIKANVREGMGAALISATAVRAELERGHLERLKDKRSPVPRPIYVVQRADRHLAPAATALLELLRANRPR